MSFLGKIFGKKAPAPAPPPLAPTTTPAPPPLDPAKDPNMIRVFDSYGRELFITKQQWRDNVLLGHIQKVWHQPEELAQVVIQALRDGFAADMLKPAVQLLEIDPHQERAATVLAIIYRELKRLDDAEKVLRDFIARHGETGSVLTNLAKVYTDRGQPELALQTLWRGLQLDPNQDNGMGWYEVIHREKEGAAGSLAALQRVAAVPGAWRARLWLARDALVRRDLPAALAYYDEALACAPTPAPTDMLQQISGDLGNHAHLPEILGLVAPRFDVAYHGLEVGNNLIKANLDLGRLDAARVLLEQHYAQKRPDWKETLSFWDTELAKAQVAISQPAPAEKVSVALLSIEGPVWLAEDSPALELFPALGAEAVRIAFLGSTAETGTMGDKPMQQLSDMPGRASRAIPLFLAEQVQFHARAAARTLVPWLQGERPAFVLSGVPWDDGDAAQHARTGDKPCDYVVVTHLKASQPMWQVELRLIRTIDAKCLGGASASFTAAETQNALPVLASHVLQLLQEHADVELAASPSLYQVPAGSDFPYYLLRLEQLLAVRCTTMPGTPPGFLNGEREILDGNLQLCLNRPGNVVARIVFAQTLARMKKVHPQVVEEYRDKVRLLQKEKPLTGTTQAVIERVLTEVYS